MLANIWLFFFGSLVALALFWSVPADRPQARQIVLLSISAALVLLYSLGGFFFCICLAITPLLAQRVFFQFRNIWSFWLFIALALCPLVGLRVFSEQSFFLSFGVAFATVKSLGLVMIAYGGRQHLKALDAFLLIFFFPLFTVGPVEKISTFAQNNFANRFDFKQAIYGVYRIAVGLFLVMFIGGEILDPIRNQWFGRAYEDIAVFSQSQALGLIIASFLYTYINFEGFSSVAIGLSRIFGLKVFENFDRPLLVSNIAEFWKRYHISMGNAINQFIFFPIVLWLKRPWATYAATIVAFILFGMWHAFDLNYFIWGLGNGLGVAMVHYGANKKIFPLFKESAVARLATKALGGILTLLFISWIQTFANLEDFETAVLMTAKLLGLS
ncbi:hypothetical protein RA28_21395 [Ruegeria sp. ANG-S4]|uniref:MBOAT family O-acyltransferase n=1 Tax=Ruegeria sp. ANG-S4 TaxID=1577904 RepID=UPI0005800A1D|nr:MBOAT family O-acyltransferase [Ruegeria sp. ANG-S4]KIC40942.1 hypothetical protein RA28_21395 [Ruegeria sp. ANG-S4]